MFLSGMLRTFLACVDSRCAEYRALREQRNGRIKHVLDEFKDLDRLTDHARAPVYPCPGRKNEKCPGPDEFANFLEIGNGI